MKKDTVIALKKPEVLVEDPLTEVLRRGAKQLLVQALEAEIASFLKLHEHVRDESGKWQVSRNGYMPDRTVQTGIGDIEVRAPRAADRRKNGGAKIRFTSSII